MNSPLENNPVRHTHIMKAQMRQMIKYLREDVGKITEAKAQAIFETSAEVLTGLVKTFDDYERKSEAAWQTEPKAPHPRERSSHASRR